LSLNSRPSCQTVKSLFEVKECCCTILFKLKGGSYLVDYLVTQKDGGVKGSKTKLVVKDGVADSRIGYRCLRINFSRIFPIMGRRPMGR
jgi:hypothetical protein